MHDKSSKCVCKRWLCAMHDQSMENAYVGQGVLNTQPWTKHVPNEEKWEAPKFGTHQSPNKWENA